MQKFLIPTKPHEIRVKEAVEYATSLEVKKPDELKEYDQLIGAKALTYIKDLDFEIVRIKIKPFLQSYVSFWSKMPEAKAAIFDLVQLLDFYNKIQSALYTPLESESKLIDIFGKKFKLPSKFLQDEILGQYAECDQFEKFLEDKKLSFLAGLPFFCAWLLRRENENLFFCDKNIKKRENAFEMITLDVALCVYTIWSNAKNEISKRFGPSLYSKPTAKEKRAGQKQLQDKFGWVLTIKRLAETKVFDLPKYNSQDSVLRTNLWECLTYLAASNETSKYQERLYTQD